MTLLGIALGKINSRTYFQLEGQVCGQRCANEQSHRESAGHQEYWCVGGQPWLQREGWKRTIEQTTTGSDGKSIEETQSIGACNAILFWSHTVLILPLEPGKLKSRGVAEQAAKAATDANTWGRCFSWESIVRRSLFCYWVWLFENLGQMLRHF